MILNRQRTVPVSLASLERFWQQVRETLGLPEDSMTICLVSEAEIARWNRAYRAKSGPTDVLSFPADEEADGHFVAPPSLAASGGRLEAGATKYGNGSRGSAAGKAGRGARRRPVPPAGERELAGYLGDIAIAPTVARRNARRLGRSLGRELRILMLHGALHLLGYDHERDHGEMERLERRPRPPLRLGEGWARCPWRSGGWRLRWAVRCSPSWAINRDSPARIGCTDFFAEICSQVIGKAGDRITLDRFPSRPGA